MFNKFKDARDNYVNCNDNYFQSPIILCMYSYVYQNSKKITLSWYKNSFVKMRIHQKKVRTLIYAPYLLPNSFMLIYLDLDIYMFVISYLILPFVI